MRRKSIQFPAEGGGRRWRRPLYRPQVCDGPHPRIRRLLALWYLRRLEGVNEVELVRPYVAALDVLVQNLPEPWRTRAAAGALDRIEQTHTDAGEEPPSWLVTLRERIARHAQ